MAIAPTLERGSKSEVGGALRQGGTLQLKVNCLVAKLIDYFLGFLF
jgi:hypothetical protein